MATIPSDALPSNEWFVKSKYPERLVLNSKPVLFSCYLTQWLPQIIWSSAAICFHFQGTHDAKYCSAQKSRAISLYASNMHSAHDAIRDLVHTRKSFFFHFPSCNTVSDSGPSPYFNRSAPVELKITSPLGGDEYHAGETGIISWYVPKGPKGIY
jgi:hypothetical protein